VGLRFFVGGYSQQWGYFAAGSIIVAIPVVALFFVLQKYLISGLTAGAVKG
jgi:arabinogalactan oligomer/maltooligosaccharide transport system permease protein